MYAFTDEEAGKEEEREATVPTGRERGGEGGGGGGFSSHRDQKSGTSSEKGGGGHHQMAKITWTEFMSGSILIECQLRFQVNFDWNLFEIIHEVRVNSWWNFR